MKREKSKNTKQSVKKVLRNDFYMLWKILKTTPSIVVSILVSNIISGLLNSVSTLFTYFLLNSLDEGKSFDEILPIIIWTGTFYVMSYLFFGWYLKYYDQLIRRKLFMKLHTELFKKAYSLDVSCYDDPEFYNDFVWAMDNAGGESTSLLTDFASLIRGVVSGGTMVGILLTIDPIMAGILFASSIISIIAFHYGNKYSFEQEKAQKPLYRVRNYINRIFYLPDYAKEMRSGHIADVLINKADDNVDELVRSRKKYGKKYFVIYTMLGSVLGTMTDVGVMLYMLSRLIEGSVLIGAFAASVAVIWNLRWNISNIIEQAATMPKHSLFLEKYYEFLDYKPRTKSGLLSVPSFESLELKDVSFTYDFSDNPKYQYHDEDYVSPQKPPSEALKNVSLKLNKGEKIALVGYNGAGKTTLIKLLMRLYDPSSGEVKMNGINIKEFDLADYRKRIGTVFQDYKIFAKSIAENVMNGPYDESKKGTVLSALNAAGFSEKLSELDNGIDTQLTREFDDNGTNLSGGESQKVAIARVFAKPFELIIMDEPSSALDPIAEYELNQAILKYASDKTVIFISHRLSTTRMADKIYMFDSGRLIEEGSHDELMEINGKYAEMFNLQAEKYFAE